MNFLIRQLVRMISMIRQLVRKTFLIRQLVRMNFLSIHQLVRTTCLIVTSARTHDFF